MRMATQFAIFVPLPDEGIAWTERMEAPRCKYPFDMYLMHFDTLENNPDLRWLYLLLRYQQMWRDNQEYKHGKRPMGKRTLETWPGLVGPHFNYDEDISVLRMPKPDPGFIDKSTGTDERILKRPKRILHAPSTRMTRQIRPRK